MKTAKRIGNIILAGVGFLTIFACAVLFLGALMWPSSAYPQIATVKVNNTLTYRMQAPLYQTPVYGGIAGQALMLDATGFMAPLPSYYTTPEYNGAKGDGTTNDATALQACIHRSAITFTKCTFRSIAGYNFSSTLILEDHSSLEGASGQGGATTLISSVNGDAFQIAAGPVRTIVSNFYLFLNASLPNTRAFHIQGTALAGYAGGGGMWDSKISNMQIDGCALECIWLDGGGSTSMGLYPNQFIEFDHMVMEGPDQSHPQPLIRMTGQDAQIRFIGGRIDGENTLISNYPALIVIGPHTSGGNDSPGNVTFDGFTAQAGTVALSATTTDSIAYVHGWIENVATPVVASRVLGLEVRANYIANSGETTGITSLSNSTTGTFSGNYVATGGTLPPYFAVCSNYVSVSFADNSSSNSGFDPSSTSGCATGQVSPAAGLTLWSPTVIVQGDGGTTPIQTITAPNVASGQTLSLYAYGGQSFKLATGGNLTLGSATSPLTVPAGTSVTFRKYDYGVLWVLEAAH